MKLRVIAKTENMKSANLQLKKEGKVYLPNEEFEVDNERGKELLKIKWEGNPIVEEVKEVPKGKNKAAKEETTEEEIEEE